MLTGHANCLLLETHCLTVPITPVIVRAKSPLRAPLPLSHKVRIYTLPDSEQN
jgi:hypothetical protein